MKTRDPVNQYLAEEYRNLGLERLGIMNSSVWRDDPRRLVFTLSRYKFVAKMLEGAETVAEVGCGDGFGSRIVKQSVQTLTITDYDPFFIERFNEEGGINDEVSAYTHDILAGPLNEQYDAIYSLDVLEHISPTLEDAFLENLCSSMAPSGVAIIGIPSLESQSYASAESKEGHVNCKNGYELKITLEKYFRHVFIFSMNDEVVHTGYFPMAHYLLALCCDQI
jgi:2-polyprenyl-3-methyl-5-hydroxy-6-metoxy-1,4-benzoquinol methylase